MPRFPAVMAIALGLLLAAPALAQPDVRTLADGQASPPAGIQAVAWLAGRWVGEGLGGEAEETYAPPADGQMIGHFRHTKDGKAVFYEFLLIRERGGSLVYGVKHFNPDATAWEEKDRWTEFPLVAVEDGRVVFDGLTYERDGADRLLVHLSLRNGKTGARRIETFRFRRAP
ncbi:DUF6265 family protein [Phenylobacterium sp.]|uniref:DUF6265 family protein n=1 Tax=Phenylobacterium sp. TaxID=1871053 RepID=UPI0035AF1B53